MGGAWPVPEHTDRLLINIPPWSHLFYGFGGGGGGADSCVTLIVNDATVPELAKAMLSVLATLPLVTVITTVPAFSEVPVALRPLVATTRGRTAGSELCHNGVPMKPVGCKALTVDIP